jgi:Ohr subfamily peroxiredoxin
LLDVMLAEPGSLRIGTNPEQLLAAGWSACFGTALTTAARNRNLALPSDVSIDAEADLMLADDGHFLRVRLKVGLGGVAPEVAQVLIQEAHAICPYSKAMRGNIDVAVSLETPVQRVQL